MTGKHVAFLVIRALGPSLSLSVIKTLLPHVRLVKIHATLKYVELMDNRRGDQKIKKSIDGL